MNARFPASLLLAALLAACSAADPELSSSSGSGGRGGSGTTVSTGGAVITGSVTGTASGGAGAGGADGGACTYGATYCQGATCICQLSPPSPNCVTADSNGTPANGCDDGNPCTQDVADPAAPGGCKHLFFGLGASCSADHAMQCVVGGTGTQCCPTDPHPICSVEGQQGECAAGSVCLEGMCWVSCTTPKDCLGSSLGPNCNPLSVGHVSVKVCGA